MKQLLLFFTLFCTSYMTVNAQTNTWTGNADNNWSNVANWSLNAVPTASNDVIIPTGKTVNLNVVGTTKSIVVQGNSTFNIANNLAFINGSSFATNTTISWSNGNLSGGGTLTNNGTLNMTTDATRFISDGSIVNNSGTFNMKGNFILYINGGTLNNQSSGIIDIQSLPSLAPNTNLTHTIVNSGLIKKTTNDGNSTISVALTNTGTIAVESGTLTLSGEAKTFNGGVYNVTTGATLALSAEVNLSNTITGLVNGNLNWNNKLSVATTATFSLTGTAGINWRDGLLSGGGILTNTTKMNLTTGATKFITGATTLSNTGTLNLVDSFILYINSGILKNMDVGVIDIQGLPSLAPNTSDSHSIVNSGLIKKTNNAGISNISVALINTGTISVQNGTLTLSGEAKTFNGGIFNVTSGNTLNLSSIINLSNTMTGLINGDLNWKSTIAVATTGAFNFTGSAGLKWVDGNLSGGGTLTNMTKMSMTTDATKFIIDGTTLSNTGTFICAGNNILYIREGVINNQVSGVVDIQALPSLAPDTNLSHSIVNSGLIKKTMNTGISTLSVALTNTGIITVESGTLTLSGEAKTFTGGTYNVSSGALLNLSTQIFSSGTFIGTLAAPISWNGIINVAPSQIATLSFTGTAGINWANGFLSGGGTLLNTSKLNMTSGATRFITDGTTLKNTGTINSVDNYILYINEGVLNNEASGVIDIKSLVNFAPNTGLSHNMINAGLIKKSVNDGIATISIALTNTGTISVESGTLTMSGEAKTFNNGIYNVSAASLLNFSTTINCSGTLTGTATGPISWNNVINVVAASPATFNFTGTSGINFADGSLNGGGVLTNAGKMNMTTAATKFIIENTTLSNIGTINCLGDFILYINYGILNNQISGIIDIKSQPTFAPNTAQAHSMNNSGLIKKTTNSGVANLNVMLTNSGTIDSQMGTLNIAANPFVNTVDGIVKGIATVDLPPLANYTNNGTFAPGGSPGTLTVLGDYKSSTTSVLDVELNGLAQGTQYDLLAISGTNAIFNGTVNVTLGFAPVLNNEFVIATTTGTITQCNLASTTTAVFNGMQYTFNVLCRNGNQVVLKVNNITLGIDDFELSESSIQLYPNPVQNILTIKNMNNLELDNAQVMDITGKVITTLDLKNMGLTKDISLENFSSGMYFVKINGLNSSITKRIIKE